MKTLVTILIFILAGTAGLKSQTCQSPFRYHNENRIGIVQSGTYRLEVLKSKMGGKSEFSLCVEISDGGTRPDPACYRNLSGIIDIICINDGNTITVLTKDCDSCPGGGGASVTERVWNDVDCYGKVTWKSADGFVLSIKIKKIETCF